MQLQTNDASASPASVKGSGNLLGISLIAALAGFIFGFDTDTKDVFDETLKQINKLGIDTADFCILTPLPGTPIYDKLEKEKRILTKDWSQYTLKNPVFKPKNMTDKELLTGVRKMYYKYYSPSNNIKRIFKSMRLGMLPFLLVLQRTFVAAMSHRKLFF